MTFVAGTFCHHPLAMVTALKTLELLEENQGEVLKTLNSKTEKFCARLNTYFQSMNYPIITNHFASLFRFTTPGKTSILYNYLLLNGVYVWEGRNCFLSPAHSEEILEDLFLIIKKSCEQMEQDGFLIPKKKK